MQWKEESSVCPSANSAVSTQMAVDQQHTLTRIPSTVGEQKRGEQKYVTN